MRDTKKISCAKCNRDQHRDSRRQIAVAPHPNRHICLIRARDRRNKTVSLLGLGANVDRIRSIVAQGGAKLRNAEIQPAREIHKCLRAPDRAAQLFARNYLTPALQQICQHQPGLRLQVDQGTFSPQLVARRVEFENSEAEFFARHPAHCCTAHGPVRPFLSSVILFYPLRLSSRPQSALPWGSEMGTLNSARGAHPVRGKGRAHPLSKFTIKRTSFSLTLRTPRQAMKGASYVSQPARRTSSSPSPQP